MWKGQRVWKGGKLQRNRSGCKSQKAWVGPGSACLQPWAPNKSFTLSIPMSKSKTSVLTKNRAVGRTSEIICKMCSIN